MSNFSNMPLNKLPVNVPVLCIPRVFSNITEERIRRIFDQLNIGTLTRVDIINKQDAKGDKFNRVFIHLDWNNSENANMSRERLMDGKDIKILYDNPWFWKASAYRQPEHTPTVSRVQKAIIQFDSDEETPRQPEPKPRQQQDQRPSHYSMPRQQAPSQHQAPRQQQDQRPSHYSMPRQQQDPRPKPTQFVPRQVQHLKEVKKEQLLKEVKQEQPLKEVKQEQPLIEVKQEPPLKEVKQEPVEEVETTQKEATAIDYGEVIFPKKRASKKTKLAPPVLVEKPVLVLEEGEIVDNN